ncbi:unnamed protein product [Boreogadus saida]
MNKQHLIPSPEKRSRGAASLQASRSVPVLIIIVMAIWVPVRSGVRPGGGPGGGALVLMLIGAVRGDHQRCMRAGRPACSSVAGLGATTGYSIHTDEARGECCCGLPDHHPPGEAGAQTADQTTTHQERLGPRPQTRPPPTRRGWGPDRRPDHHPPGEAGAQTADQTTTHQERLGPRPQTRPPPTRRGWGPDRRPDHHPPGEAGAQTADQTTTHQERLGPRPQTRPPPTRRGWGPDRRPDHHPPGEAGAQTADQTTTHQERLGPRPQTRPPPTRRGWGPDRRPDHHPPGEAGAQTTAPLYTMLAPFQLGGAREQTIGRIRCDRFTFLKRMNEGQRITAQSRCDFPPVE